MTRPDVLVYFVPHYGCLYVALLILTVRVKYYQIGRTTNCVNKPAGTFSY